MSNSSRSSADPALSTGHSLVVVVDDDPVLRAGFVDMLKDAGFLVESFGSAEDLLESGRARDAACLLLDAGLPGISGVEVLKRLRESGDHVAAVMITGLGDVDMAVRSMKAGASDFLEKPASGIEIIAAIERAIDQKINGSALDALRLEASRFTARLTPRQREILEFIIDGRPNKIIAADLGISQRTIENHRAAIMRKSGVKSLPALTRMVFAANLSLKQSQPGSAAQSLDVPFGGVPVPGEIESDRFERYFDQIPLAVVVSAMAAPEQIIYANPAFEDLSGQSRAEIEGEAWSILRGVSLGSPSTIALADAVLASSDLVGTFQIDRSGGSPAMADVYSNVIVDDEDGPAFRLAAFVDVGARDNEKLQEFELQMREKDTRMLEMQHRVKNNLQMITALVRIEARKAHNQLDTAPFDRLAGRIHSLQLLYKLLSEADQGNEIDLGVYLSEIASSIMHSSAVEGIRLDLKVDSYLVSVNVALPTGMVVNELLTNALKHAFVDRQGGTITLQSLTDDKGCRVVVADDGVGLPPETSWPTHGKLGALIVESLRQNAKAEIAVESKPGKGMRVTIKF